MKRISWTLFLLLGFGLLTIPACQSDPEAADEDAAMTDQQEGPLDWVKNANIYEVNVRQYTPEGTFSAFAEHLPRLQEMGVKILWFMPIYPISEKNRKGTLGSYYAISDYKAVNPEFGTMEEFKALVDRIHSMGMKVVLDWVANHTGWDGPWIEEHPEWFTKNAEGEITDPIGKDGKSWGWTDVADLDYEAPEMRAAMIDAMQFWVREADVDGFRCDVAAEVPDDFWLTARPALDSIKPVFMLAEAEYPTHRNNGSFDMSYGWSFHHLMNDIAQGKKDATAIDTWLADDQTKYQKGYHMQFITNHDENSWNGTVQERLGEGADAMAVLAFTFDGMPLIYSGQEAGMDKRLEFFEKDTIDWGKVSKKAFYTTLLELKRDNPALWNGQAGGAIQKIPTSNDQAVYAFMREKGDNRVVVILNLSADSQEVKLMGGDFAGDYTNVFRNSGLSLTPDMMIQLNPWDYLVLVK